MKTGAHVWSTKFQQETVYYNTISGEMLPLDASAEQLHDKGFMDHQWRSSLIKRLCTVVSPAHFNVVPSWNCNLRCTHCSISERLTNRKYRFEPDKICDFLRRYINYYHTTMYHLSFVGGEPLLDSEKCHEVLQYAPGTYRSTITTNLTNPLNKPTLRFLIDLDEICVSIDGLESDHNRQRRVVAGGNSYRSIVDNLKILRKLGLLEKVLVKCVLPDHLYNEEYTRQFYRSMIRLGIRRIECSGIHPARIKPSPTNVYLDTLSQPVSKPCCKWRLMSVLQLDEDSVSCNYYREDGKLGLLSDPIDLLENRHKDLILTKMPVLNDPGCQGCPVVAMCWGQCVKGDCYLGDSPSQKCARTQLIQKVGDLAEDGKLVGYQSNDHL